SVSWVDGSESALCRELVKLVEAREPCLEVVLLQVEVCAVVDEIGSDDRAPVGEHKARVVLGLARAELGDLDFELAKAQAVGFDRDRLDQAFGSFGTELVFEQAEHPGSVGSQVIEDVGRGEHVNSREAIEEMVELEKVVRVGM